MNIILFNFRGLGDSTIMANAIEKYRNELKNYRITIITWSKNELIFSQLKREHEILYISGPRKNKYSYFLSSCYRIFKLLKGRQFDKAINFSGDFKENIYLLFVNSLQKISPIWDREHKMNNVITQPLLRYKNDIYIDSEIENIYKIYDYIFGLVLNTKKVELLHLEPQKVIKSIGLFPFSAQECRDWPLENWDSIGLKILKSGYGVYYFCSDQEINQISNFKSLSKGALISSEMLKVKTKVDFLICQDSFSTHLAHFIKLPSITIFGANNPSLFSTGSSEVIATDGGCKYYPCYNKPKCINQTSQYSCISSIKVNTVFDVLNSELILVDEKI